MGKALANKGRTVIEVGDLVRDHSLYDGIDEERGSLEVDPDHLAERLPPLLPDGDLILIGHLSHLVQVDLVVVLRCRPSVLRGRLEARGWSPSKVQENVEAEALDVILMEALDSGHETVEVDTTGRSPSRTVEALEEILAGEREKYAVGHVDWSQEILGWY